MIRWYCLLAGWLVCGGIGPSAGAQEAGLSFNRDIRPILSDKCFACHGPDAAAREADLRLDERSAAVADRGGQAAIVPGDDAASLLLQRVTHSDPDQRMPPPSAPQLNAAEIELLRRWVRQGAPYQRHWAFEPLSRPALPESAAQDVHHPIDAFVQHALSVRGLRPAQRADADALLRRVTLDLTGLPPSRERLLSFRRQLQQPGASFQLIYQNEVERLLQSPRFGEHLAVGWLDAARYADTNGYFGDKPRQMWLWRDWVIEAFNTNMPYDQFTVEQLAGDLLPQPALSQRIATGFNRNHMANNESGSIDEEFRVEYVADRVHTTMTTWLGLTAGCAQCHDHKFDPLSQRQYYELFAFFNNVPERGLIREDDPPPLLQVPSPEQSERLAELESAAQQASEAFQPLRRRLEEKIATWEPTAAADLPEIPNDELLWHEPFAEPLRQGSSPQGTTLSREKGVLGEAAKFDATQHVEVALSEFHADAAWTIGCWLHPDGSLACPLSKIEPDGARRGLEMIWGKGALTIHLVHRWGVDHLEVSTEPPTGSGGWRHVVVVHDGSRRADGLRVFVDGQAVRLKVHRDTLQGTIENTQPLRIGRRDDGLGYYGLLDELRILQRAAEAEEVRGWYWSERISGILATPAAQRTAAQKDPLLDYYLQRYGQPEEQAARVRAQAAAEAERALRDAIPSVLVMQEMDTPRVTRVLERGEYDRPTDEVSPGVPTAIAPWPPAAPPNRLGLAQWIVSPHNPLTARVAANRLWQHCFGAGLVQTVDDFGSQGEPPSHPMLLDWLAVELRDSGWDIKRLLRLIVTSHAYQQQANDEQLRAADPDGRQLARGPRRRLSAEMLRDQALAVSGLLVEQVGGPSVKPYQPPGLWEAVSYNGDESYQEGSGAQLWRRSVYTYVKRQAPPPLLLTFDGPTREKCVLRRETTSTPMQALLLLNDRTFIAAARALAARSLTSASDDRQRLQWLYQTVLSRDAHAEEVQLLEGLLQRQLQRFDENPQAAEALLDDGQSLEPDSGISLAQWGAWTVVAHTLLNLDEALTR